MSEGGKVPPNEGNESHNQRLRHLDNHGVVKAVVAAITNDFYSEGFTLAKARAIVNVGVGKGSLSELEEPYHEGLRHYDNQSVV